MRRRGGWELQSRGSVTASCFLFGDSQVVDWRDRHGTKIADQYVELPAAIESQPEQGLHISAPSDVDLTSVAFPVALQMKAAIYSISPQATSVESATRNDLLLATEERK